MVFVAVAAVAGITALALARLIGHADASLSTAARLYEVAARLNAVEANEWELIAERTTPSPIAQELDGNLAAAAALIDDLSARLPNFEPVSKRFTDYHRALDEEIRLMKTGDYDTVRNVDLRDVDPAFDRLKVAIDSAVVDHERLAVTENRQTRILGGLAITAATAVIAVLVEWLVLVSVRSDEARRRARMLRESEERYRTLFEESHDALAVTDMEGRITDLNRAATELFGGPREAFMGKAISQFYEPGGETIGAPSLAGLSVGDDEREVRVPRKDSAPRECVMAASALKDDSGQVIGSQLFIRDITEHNRLDRQFRHAQKMDVVGRLAGGIAHDFNNLLTSILGHTELLLRELTLTAEQRTYLEEVDKAGRSAASLTRQLLAFSRKQAISPAILDLSAMVSAFRSILQRTIGEDVAIVLALDPHLDYVKADEGQIEQVLMNLAVNARDAMPEGGTLTIATANVTFDQPGWSPAEPMSAGRYVTLSASDTGVGITAAVQAHLFEPFFTTKGVGKGTGLGLSTVYGIVKQHAGAIVFENAPGGGSIFKIYLPRTDPPPAMDATGAATAEALPKSAGGETILVVEDNDSLRRLAVRVLQREGYVVLEAGDGEEALRVAPQHQGPIHLLLTDMLMPGIGGAELADRVAEQRPETRILYMSGYTDEWISNRGVSQPRREFIPKPFTPEILVREVRRTLQERRPVPARLS